MMISKDIESRLGKIKALVMDVDGTLTDSAMYYSSKGEELKRFSTRDGMGISLLHANGFRTAIITSEMTEIVTARAKKLNIEHVKLGIQDKVSALNLLAEEMGLNLSDIAYIGDDVNDLNALKIAGFSACPADAVDAVKTNVHYICTKNGGNGAVREIADIILSVNNSEINQPNKW
jgi:3-deoxy-D-manno-octulosonate 8-phosphate phosphatase (KDO 8-P phosphatase)